MRATCLLPLLCALAVAQSPPAKKPPKQTEPEGVQVAIDAIVTTAGGNVLPGLTAKDFELLQGEQKPKITAVKFVESKPGLNASAPAGGPVRWAGMELSAEERTLLVIVVDDIGLSADGRTQLRSTLATFITQRLRRGEFVSIVPTSGGSVKQHQFSSDRGKLLASLEAIPFHPGAGAAALTTASAQSAASRAVLSLQTILGGLKAIPGRKSVVFFSENMWLFKNPNVLDWYGGYDEYGLKQRKEEGELRTTLSATANLASVVFYAADPRAVNPATARTGDNMQIEIYSGLGRLARETGGIFFDNTNDPARVLDRVEQELAGYYKITFSSSAKNESGSLPFLRPTVKVLNPAASVRTRTGMLKVKEESEGFDPGQALIEMLPAVASPFSFGEIDFGLNAVFSRTTRGVMNIDLLLQVNMHDVSYTLEKDGTRHCTLEIAIALVRQSGFGDRHIVKGFDIRLKPSEYETIRHFGLPLRARIVAENTGPTQIVAGLRDLTSGKVGANRAFLDIPNLSDKRLHISGILVSNSRQAYAIETTPGLRDPKEEPVAISQIRASNQLDYSYQVFNAAFDKEKTARLDVTVKLYRNGTVLHDGAPSPVVFQAVSAITRLTIGGKIHFKESMPTGEYSLQVIVKDKLVPNRESDTSTQHFNFTVIE